MANIVPGRHPLQLEHFAVLAVFGAAFGCSRTGLEDLRGASLPPSEETRLVDAAAPMVTASVSASTSSDAPPTKPPPTPPRCTPMPEECNGVDDDCNGQVDDGIAAVPCVGGGNRYCIAGRLSACPMRCDACVPGSERVCFHSYCTYWAVEACTADGKSFGICRERQVPAECADIASRHQDSPELEQCCIDNGYCCHDEFDLDHDGNRGEMLGTCDEVSCHP